MEKSLVIQLELPEHLAQVVHRAVYEEQRYATPQAYLQALVAQDDQPQDTAAPMTPEEKALYDDILEGFRDIAEGRYFESTGDWKKDLKILEEKEKNGWR